MNKCRLAFVFAVFVVLSFTSCTQDPQIWELKSTEQVASDFIANTEKYSEFNKLVDLTELKSLLSIRGPFTILVPTDSAMFAYYKLKDKKSLDDFTASERDQLVRYHIMSSEIPTDDISLGALREPNALGDYLATEFHKSDIYINKESRISRRNIRTANGYIHELDRVLDPIKLDVYSILLANPSYKIFSEGLRLSGLSDTLKKIDFDYGSKKSRIRYTLLAVNDSVYKSKGINNVNDLIALYGGKADSLKSMKDPFYRYMEYHCLTNSYFLSSFKTSVYPILSRDNNVSVTIAEDYKINLDRKTNTYTALLIPISNVPAKNGVIHAVNDLLPVTSPEPATLTFETTDYLEFKEGDFYGKYYKKWSDGEKSFEKIKFEGDYLLYYYKINHGRTAIANNDCISMLGFWWVEVTTPKVMKGRYAVSANIWTGGDDLPMFDAYVDGVKVANLNAKLSSTRMDFGEVTYTKTEEHKIKLVCTAWGTLFWDSIIFTPIN